jgi:hypothetical protein
MKKILLATIATSLTLFSYSQIAKDFSISVHADLIKSDNSAFFEKAQASAEVNYFISRKFTATAGAEYWTAGPQASFVMGARWFPVAEAFVRVRGLVGANDISIGGGWGKPLHENWRFEAIGDFYTGGDIAIRAGFTYLIRRK